MEEASRKLSDPLDCSTPPNMQEIKDASTSYTQQTPHNDKIPEKKFKINKSSAFKLFQKPSIEQDLHFHRILLEVSKKIKLDPSPTQP